MADIYSYTSGTVPVMIRQGALSGRVPSNKSINAIIDAELDAAYANLARRKALALQQQHLTEQQRQFDISQQNAVDTAAASRQAGLIGTGLQTVGTGLLAEAMYPGMISNLWKSTPEMGYNMYNALYGPSSALATTPMVGTTGMTAAGASPAAIAEYGATNIPISVAGETTLGTISPAAGVAAKEGATALAGETSMGAVGETLGGYYSSVAPYATSALAGYGGSQVGGILGQELGEAIGVGGKSERGFVGKVGGGALAGTYFGGFPVGTAVGGAIGLIDWGLNEGGGFVSDAADFVGDVAGGVGHAVSEVVDFITSW